MITLRKRLSVHDRVGKVTVIDMLKAGNEVVEYLANKFGKEKSLNIYKQYLESKYTWLVVNENSLDYCFYITFEDILKDYKSFSMFTKQDRSSFKYWFAHWCGFQLTALNLGIWKPKYLLHDIEKPWLKLCWNYKKVQQWHRTHNNHHLEYGLEHGWDAIDWEALMIDWECCGLSKQEAQLDARETLDYEIHRDKWEKYANEISIRLGKLLYKYNL